MAIRLVPTNPVAHIAAQLNPFRQGQLDALCGIYCTLNAVQIAAHPVRPIGVSKARSLFTSAVSAMRKHHSYLNPLSQGMANKRMIWLAHHIVKSANTKRMRFVVEVCDCDDIENWIRQSLDLGAPVVACLIDSWHFSVIVDVTLDALVLFDSQGTSSLPISRSGSLVDMIDQEGTIRIRLNMQT